MSPSASRTTGSGPCTWMGSLRPAAAQASRIALMPGTGSMASSPHGIHPVPKRTSRSRTRWLVRPLTQIGTPPVATGFGMAEISVNDSSSDV